MEDKKLPKRDQVPEEFTWNLKDIFESDEAWAAENESLKAALKEAEAFRGRLGESAEALLGFFRLDDKLSVRAEKLYCYASCKSDQDISNSFYQDMRGKAVSTLTRLSESLSYAAPEIMAIDEDKLNLFYIAQPDLRATAAAFIKSAAARRISSLIRRRRCLPPPGRWRKAPRR